MRCAPFDVVAITSEARPHCFLSLSLHHPGFASLVLGGDCAHRHLGSHLRREARMFSLR